jgi:hypothetical protein
MKSSVGRLTNAACIMPHMHRFMGRIRKLKDQCVETNKQGAKLSHTFYDDFLLMQKVLWKARDGVSINLLTHRAQFFWLQSDASEHGLGGMNINQEMGWRWLIPYK